MVGLGVITCLAGDDPNSLNFNPECEFKPPDPDLSLNDIIFVLFIY
jgi:hypothetical protein